MSDSNRVLVVLCTYNERENLPKVIEGVHGCLPRADILIVDDNSPDGTGMWVRNTQSQNSKLHLLSRPGKLGLGTALRDAIAWCLEREYDFLINLDADLSHDPRAVGKMLEPCVSGHCDVAVSSRYAPGGGFKNLAWHRRLLSRVLNLYAVRILRLPITDCSGSFRCYSTAALRKLDLSLLHCPGYGFLEEILVKLHRQDAKLCDVPIVFESRWRGHSKLSFGDAWGAFKVIHRLALRN